jgi:hypothetical protein
MSQECGKSYQIDRTIFVILDDLIRTKYPPIFCLFHFTINLGIRFDLHPFFSQASSINLPKVFVVVLQTKNHGFNTQLHTLSFPRLTLALSPSRTPSPNLLILSPRYLLSNIISTIPILQPQYLDLTTNIPHLLPSTQ